MIEGRKREPDEGMDLSRLADCACFNLRKASRAVTQLFDEHLKPSGIRATQFTLLVVLNNLGTSTITALAGKLGMDRTTLTRNLNLLEQAGMAISSTGKDRRKRSVALTDKGRETLREAVPLWEGAQKQVVDGLGTNRWGSMLEDLSDTVSTVKPG